MNGRVLAVSLSIAALFGCATPEPPPVAPQVVTEAAPPPPREQELRRDTLKHLANRKLKPIETRPLNAKARCSFRDPTGYRGRLSLDVSSARVKQLDARVDMPKKGSCSFRLKDFQQTESLPNVVLQARQGSCKLSLYEQDHLVTLAFRDCRKECDGSSVDYLWPILVDNRKGSCS